MPLVNTVEHRESTSSSHQTAVNGKWSDPKTTHSSSAKYLTNTDGVPNSSINNYSSRRSDGVASPIGGFSSSYNPPPPPLLPRSTIGSGSGSLAASQAAQDMERQSHELEQDFWARVNESRSRMGMSANGSIGGPGESKFTSSIGAPLRTISPAPPQNSSQSYRSTSSASSSYNNANKNNGYTTTTRPYGEDTFSRKPQFDNNDLLPSHFRTTPTSLINSQPLVPAFPDNLDDITKHTKDLAVQGIDSNIEDLPNGMKLMRWGFDVQGFEPHEIHVKTVGDEQLEIHGKHEEKSGGYSNYSEFSKSVSLPPNTRFDEMRSVFDTRSQRLSVEAPFKPLRMQTAGALTHDFHDSGIHDSGYGQQQNNGYRATPPPTNVSDRYMSNIPIGLTTKQRESYRSTTSSSSSSSKNNNNNNNNTNKYDYSAAPRSTGPYINTGAIERSSSAHTNRTSSGSGGGPSRSPMGVRFEDDNRYSNSTSSSSRNAGGVTSNIPVRYETTSAAKERFLSNNNNNNNNSYSSSSYQQPPPPPVVKTTTEYSRRVHESTLNETRPVGGSGSVNGYDSSRRIGYQPQSLSRDRTDVRVESVGE